VADPHGSKKALGKIGEKAVDADIVLIAGDVTLFGMDLDPVLKKINSWKRPTYLIQGNHENPKRLKKSCSKYAHLVYFDEQAYEIGNYLFLAIEGSGFSSVDKHFDKVSKKFMPLIKKKRKIFTKAGIPFHYILMTHAPPYRTKCDLLWVGEHCGNKSIRNFIARSKPELAICGHIHEAFDTEDRIGNTIVVNPGMYGRMFDI